MLKYIRILIIFTTLALALTIDDQDDATVEIDSEDSIPSVNIGQNDTGDVQRNGKLLWSSIHSPVVDMFIQTTSNTFHYKSSGDFFDFLRDSYPLPVGLKTHLSEYDFIIIGAGSAGSVMASRLTENRNITVLLLEVGKPEMLLTDVPALAPYFQATDYAWQYHMQPQDGVCLGMEKGRCFWPRGKAVGGTSVINYMIYTRGRPEDWNKLEAQGNYGWSYEDILKHYTQIEKSRLNGYEQAAHRGQDGELPVEFVPVKTKLLNAFLEAGEILGHPTVDYNAPEKLGFGRVQVTMQRGHRQSAAKAFLHSHKRRKNLHILPESTATKILIDPQTKTAYGVEFVYKKLLYTVTARKEVIVSAGPIASPQLLMLSGVGPKDDLNAVGVPLIHDLPVGQSLYDHICFPGIIFKLNATEISFLEERALKLSTVIGWLHNGDNDLTTPGGVEGIGYIKTPISDNPEPVPDIELISIGGSIVSDGGHGGSKAVRKGMRITDKAFREAFGPIDNKDTWSAFPMLLHPKSVGYLKLKDNNPFSHPLMYGNYLSDPKDVATFVAAIRHVQQLAATAPFQRYGATIHPAKYASCPHASFDSDAYWECAVRTLTVTLHHQIATCRMGPVGDPKAVVDPELRVHGIHRLRVADSSVIPETISAHTNGPAMAIGNKAAEMIKVSWNI